MSEKLSDQTPSYAVEQNGSFASELSEEVKTFDHTPVDLLLRQADAAYRSGKYDDVMSCLIGAQPVSQEQENKLNLFLRQIYQIGDIYIQRNEYDKAVDFYIQYSHFAAEPAVCEEIAARLLEIGNRFFLNRLYQKSLDVFHKGLEVIAAFDTEKKSEFLLKIGDVHYRLTHFAESAAFYIKALYENSNNRYQPELFDLIIKCAENEPDLELKASVFDRFFEFLEDAIEAEKENPIFRDFQECQISTLKTAGDVCFRNAQFDQAQKYYLELLQVCFQLKIFQDIFKRLYDVIEAYITHSNHDKALRLYEEMQKVIRYDDDYGRIIERVMDISRGEKLAERNRLLKIFSHNIKNSLIKIRSPLVNLQNEYAKNHAEFPKKLINVIKQIEKVEKTANSINFSFKGDSKDFIADIGEFDHKKSLKEIIIESLETSVENILDESGIYSNFANKYFKLDKKREARDNFYQKDKTKDFKSLNEFIRRYFFDMSCEFGNTGDYSIGDKYHSLTKLSILFDELIFNAVKYASLVQRPERFLHILINEDGNIVFIITNSYDPSNRTEKTTGIGNEVIANMVKILDGHLDVKTDQKTYQVMIQFKNFWRGDHD